MPFFFNDLSIDKQFDNIYDFKKYFDNWLEFRAKNEKVKKYLFCSKNLHDRYVTSDKTLRDAVYELKNKEFTLKILEWQTKYGPFWEDDRARNENDYFEFNHEDVTNQGLGEATRRSIVGDKVTAYSFAQENFTLFSTTPLNVQHGLPEEVYGNYYIDNIWDSATLLSEVNAIKNQATNWNELIENIHDDFPQLIFSSELRDQLMGVPTSKHLFDRIYVLLDVLNTIVLETSSDGSLTDKGSNIKSNYFERDGAIFTDESSSNKNDFQTALTFNDPSNKEATVKKIFCSWHGKIKSPQFRIHFEWPRPAGQKEIKICYIGPKITKK